MASNTVLPETVTVPSSVVLEALALLDAYADVCAEFRDDENQDVFYLIEQPITTAFEKALTPDGDGNTPLWWEGMRSRSAGFAEEIRAQIDASDTLRLAKLERVVHELGEKIIGCYWDGEHWVMPSRKQSAA